MKTLNFGLIRQKWGKFYCFGRTLRKNAFGKGGKGCCGQVIFFVFFKKKLKIVGQKGDGRTLAVIILKSN